MRTLQKIFAAVSAVVAALVAVPANANVTVKLQTNITVTSNTASVSIPVGLLQAGHVYTITTMPVGGNVTAYGNPYLWSIVYVNGSTTARVVWQSRHSPDLGERAHLQKNMLNPGENQAEFWIRCESASCSMKVTVYERKAGTFDNKTFYREGVEPGVIDGQFSLYKDFYYPTGKNGAYGLQVDYEPSRYIYLYRDDNLNKNGVLMITLPKSEEELKKRIKIEVEQ